MLHSKMSSREGVVVAVLAFVGVGCSSVGASAVRTGPAHLPPHAGPVAIIAATSPGDSLQGTELGVVEVHAAEQEGTIEALLPLFVEKVAQLGGNAAVIDGVKARFDVLYRPYTETYVYPCGWRANCVGTHVYTAGDEVMVVSIRGRAFSMKGLPSPEGAR